MCFITQDIEKLSPKIAKENITCYKLIFGPQSDRVYSLYNYTGGRKHLYMLDELQPTIKLVVVKEKYPNCTNYIINKGYHSYRKKDNYQLQFMGATSDLGIVECTIPKGATYYENNEDYVSSAIIVNRSIK